MNPEIPYGYCKCGCGQKTKINPVTDSKRGWKKGTHRAFIQGHNSRNGTGRMEKHSQWKGGVVMSYGYRKVTQPDHPRAIQNRYVLEHILVAEKAMGKPLPRTAEIHHVNRDSSDNRPQNLVVCQDHLYHRLLHQRQRALDAGGCAEWRKCPYCGQYDDPSNLIPISKKQVAHKECKKSYQRAWLHRKKLQAENPK